MKNRRVLISGASIAGPALAYWLARSGFEVTVVERAAAVRTGGQAVDFKGETHMTVLRRMGILEDVRRVRTISSGKDGLIVDADGRTIGVCPAAFSSGDLEIAGGDLAKLLVDRTAASCEYVFSDSITSLRETADAVEVEFEKGAPRTFDLVIGADGIHSNVRRLAFGPEENYVSFLGFYYALVDLGDDALNGGDEMYNEPGRMAATSGSKAPVFFVFASKPLGYERNDVEAQKQLLAAAYRGSRWKVPQLIAKLPEARDFYLDSLSRVTMDHYSRGRVVLLGDAGYGNALGGFGTGLAIVGAYVLAGELGRAEGDYRRAYAAYESKFRKYASVSQKVNAGHILAPATRLRMYLRNRLFSASVLFTGVMKLMDRFATDITLESYAT